MPRKKKPTHGGARPGAGRPPYAKPLREQPAVTVNLLPAQLAYVRELAAGAGDAEGVRRAIDVAMTMRPLREP